MEYITLVVMWGTLSGNPDINITKRSDNIVYKENHDQNAKVNCFGNDFRVCSSKEN
jgi:hypothetical protein